MGIKYIECIQNNNRLSDDIKKRILLQANIDAKQIKNNPSYKVDDKKVIKAIERIKKNNNREKLEKANDLIKLHDIINRTDALLESSKKVRSAFGGGNQDDKKILEMAMSLLDANISGNISGKELGLTVNDVAHRYKTHMGNKMGAAIRIFSTLNEEQKSMMSRAVAYKMDGDNAKLNTIKDPQVKKYIDKVYDTIKEVEKDRLKFMNESGIIIDEMEDYYFKTTHDEVKVAQMGEEGFINFLRDKIDLDKTHTPDGRTAREIGVDEYLRVFYNSIVNRSDTTKNPFDTEQKGKSILRNEQNQERLLIFNSATDAYEYKIELGKTDNIITDMLYSVERDAFNYGLSTVWGSNPEKNLQIFLNAYGDKISDSTRSSIEGLYNFKTGKNRSYDNPIAMNVVKIAKNLKMGAIMGKTFWTSYILDPIALTTTLQQRGIQPRALFPINYVKNIVAITKRMANENRKILDQSPEEIELFNEDIAMLEGLLNDNSTAMRYDGTMDDFSTQNVAGQSAAELKKREKWDRLGNKSSSIPDKLFKYTGQTRFQRMAKDYANQAVLNKINAYSGKSLDQIRVENPRYFYFLTETADITSDNWDKIRSKGRLNFSKLTELDSEESLKINKLMSDVQSLSIQEASGRVKSIGYKNSKSRDGISLAADIFFQLKSFIMQAVPNLFRRYNYEKEFNQFMGSSNNVSRAQALGEVTGFLVAGMAGAYLTTSAKAIINNETPPGEEFFTGENANKNILGLLAVSGGLGIILDIIAFDNSYGKSIAEAMIGPIGGDISKVLTQGTDMTANSAVNLAKSWIPFSNMWMTDKAAEELIFNNIKRIGNEDKYRRAERLKEKRMKETGQEYIIDF